MSRQARNTPGGLVYHVLGRADGRSRLFKRPERFADWTVTAILDVGVVRQGDQAYACSRSLVGMRIRDFAHGS